MTRARVALAALLVFFGPELTAAESTWVYSVQLTAAAHVSPPRIELTWVVDQVPAEYFTVHRKRLGESAWGEGVTLPADANSFIDENVETGARYEYQVIKRSLGVDITASGYIAVGVQAPLLENRGKIVLVVDQAIAGELTGDIARLEQDLTGDGWIVVRKDVARDGQPREIRAAIQAEYQGDRAGTRAVLLLGHVPVVRSGSLNIDGHGARPLPADVYYGEMDGEWRDANGDGIFDENVLPSDVELQVGRIDFADLPGTYAASPYPSEVELLKRYLAKNHAYRQAAVRPAPRALVGNAIGDGNGQAYAANGYRLFSALLGPARIVSARVEVNAPPEERWLGRLVRDDYTWAFGCGAGSDFTVSNLGAHGQWNDFWASDFLDTRPKAAFYLMFGSWFGDWSQSDNVLRSALASRDLGLAAAWAGRPHLFLHPMGTGESIGYGMRLSQNNPGTQYWNHVQRQLRGVHIALLGDPTLRLHVIAPPSEAQAGRAGADVLVTWQASPDEVAGYHVYRTNGDGGFTRLTGDPLTGTRFTDLNRALQGDTYMIRAIAVQNGPSGSYVNASQGAFASYAGDPTAGERAASAPAETVWFDDALPAGAQPFATPNDRWQWVRSDPAPFSGSAAHQSEGAAGLHFHFFSGATTPLTLEAGDILFADVFLDPSNPPREIMLTWLTENWEHRAYWGENLIIEGTEGGPARRFMGELPTAGQWVRLEIPASAVGLEGKSVTGMGFNLFDGRATWDRAGKRKR